MDVKWMLAIGLEAAFWIMLAAFLVLRYRYGMERVTRLFVIGVGVDTLGLVGLGVWDFAATGSVNPYTLFIAGLLLYALTAGKRDMKRLDAWMSRRARPAEPAACGQAATEPARTPTGTRRPLPRASSCRGPRGRSAPASPRR